MADKKVVPAYPGTPQGPTTGGYVPGHGPASGYPVPVSSPYGVLANGQLYTAPQVPQVPPGYADQLNLNQALQLQQQQVQHQQQQQQSAIAAAAMAQLYAAQGMHPYYNLQFPGYAQIASHPASSAAAYYPGLTYAYPHQLRPTIILPNGYGDPSARFDGIGQPVIPPAPPGVAPNAAQLAAMAGQHVALTQILHERRE